MAIGLLQHLLNSFIQGEQSRSIPLFSWSCLGAKLLSVVPPVCLHSISVHGHFFAEDHHTKYPVVNWLCQLIQVWNTHNTFPLNRNLPLGNFSRNVQFCIQMVKPLIVLLSVCRILHNWCSLSLQLGYFCIKWHCKTACGNESELCKQNLGTSSLLSLDFSRSLRIKAKSNLSF